MTMLVRSTAHAAAKTLASSGLTIKRSHLGEVLAAMLGYQTYAALAMEQDDIRLEYHIDDAEMLVLNQPAAEQRARTLGVNSTSKVIQVCVATLKDKAPIPVYEDLDEFYDSYCREALAETIWSSDDVSAAMAETNAYFTDEPELPDETPCTEDLWKAPTEWTIEVRGQMHGDHDADSDRMFAGDMLNCYGKLCFVKAGRAGLIASNSEGYAGVDDSWQMNDRDDEAAYMESLNQ